MRRSSDKLAMAALAMSLLVAAVVGIFGLPALLDVNRLVRENARLTLQNRELSQRIIREGRERRDQSCAKDEREHRADVQQLRRTYRYLRRLPRSEYGTNLTRAIVRQVPELERQARVDVAPPFCDEPGVKAERLYRRSGGRRGAPPTGLREPDPKLPKPRDFRHLLKRQ